MKKPVKIVLWILAALVALVVVAVLAVPLWVGPTARAVAVKVVPGLTGTDFRLDNLSINPYSGKVRVSEVHLANPKGYDTKDAFSVKSVSVDFSFASLFSNKIHVYDVTIEDPFVSYVFDDAGSNNFERILATVNEKLGSKEEPEAKKEEPAEEKKGGKKVVIDRLCINGTKVKYRMITLPIPVPTLKNIGGGENSEGASPEEVKETVWNSVKDKFSSVGGALGALTGNASDAVKGLVGGGTKAAEDAAKAATDAAKAATATVGEGAKKATDAAKAAAAAMSANTEKANEIVGGGAKAAADGAKAATEAVGNGAKAATDAAADAAKKATEGLKKLNPFGK